MEPVVLRGVPLASVRFGVRKVRAGPRLFDIPDKPHPSRTTDRLAPVAEYFDGWFRPTAMLTEFFDELHSRMS